MGIEHEVEFDAWCCSFISSSCASDFWQLNMHRCLLRLPIDICTVIIHKCLVMYTFMTGWNNTDSYWGLSCFAQVIIPIKNRLTEGGVVSEAGVVFSPTNCARWQKEDSWNGLQIFLLCQIGYQHSTASPVVYVLHPWPSKSGSFLWPDFQDEGSVCCTLIENHIYSSPLQVPFARLFISEVKYVCQLKVRDRMAYCLLCISETIFILCFLGYSQSQMMHF